MPYGVRRSGRQQYRIPPSGDGKQAETPMARPLSQLVVQRALHAPTTLAPDDVVALQRTLGNEAVQRLLANPIASRQAKPTVIKSALVVQPKLALGPANDRYEQEADRVAQQIVGSGSQPAVQRDRLDAGQPQAKALHGPKGGDIHPGIAQSIQRAKGGGRPLHDGVRSSMEQGFGADFSGVRVHTGNRADVLNRSLNAKAFTSGSDIFFGKGQYNPGSSSGQQLIAHELTHTVQQGAVAKSPNKAQAKRGAGAGDGVVQRAGFWQKLKTSRLAKKYRALKERITGRRSRKRRSLAATKKCSRHPSQSRHRHRCVRWAELQRMAMDGSNSSLCSRGRRSPKQGCRAR